MEVTMKALYTSLLMALIMSINTNAQELDKVVLARIAVDEFGDTIPHIFLRPVYCFSKPKFKNAKEEKDYYHQYAKMKYNLKKVYPYAQVVRQKLREMDAEFMRLETKKEQKIYLDKVEKELFKEFEKPLRKLTISQGKMLIKLIDRETGKTGYQIIKELRGGFSAFFWQTIAILFDSSLKAQIEADGNDKILNELIILYENGQL
jgi:hypothetical protein